MTMPRPQASTAFSSRVDPLWQSGDGGQAMMEAPRSSKVAVYPRIEGTITRTAHGTPRASSLGN
jgi:hypothetical protein